MGVDGWTALGDLRDMQRRRRRRLRSGGMRAGQHLGFRHAFAVVHFHAYLYIARNVQVFLFRASGLDGRYGHGAITDLSDGPDWDRLWTWKEMTGGGMALSVSTNDDGWASMSTVVRRFGWSALGVALLAAPLSLKADTV